jgi:hypothetical protein
MTRRSLTHAGGHRVVPLSPSAVAARVAIRIADYLAELDLSFSAFTPLVEQLPHVSGSIALEQRRVRICLDWARAVVMPAASSHLTASLAESSPLALIKAGRAVRRELAVGAHVAGLACDPSSFDLAAGYVWTAVLATYTLGYTQPLQSEAAPVLRSGHELLARLIAVASPPVDADDFQPWTPVVPSNGTPASVGLELFEFVATGRPS